MRTPRFLTQSIQHLYNCNFDGCKSIFTTLANMKRHEKLHSGEKPFTCPFDSCNKTFARKYDSKVHARTHTKEKPYFCQIDSCGRRFSRISSLREHERNLHGVCNSYTPSNSNQPSPTASPTPIILPRATDVNAMISASQMKDIFDFSSPSSPSSPSFENQTEQTNEAAPSTEFSQTTNSIGNTHSSCSPFPSLSLHVSLPVDDKAHAGNELWDELLHSLEFLLQFKTFLF